MSASEPNPGDLWSTPKGRTVEILAVHTVYNRYTEEVLAVAYRFLGGSMVHLRSADFLDGWSRVGAE